MGIVVSKVTRTLNSYNIVNRAHKIIQKSKPTPAPYYPSVKQQIKVAHQASPNFMETHNQKNKELDERLKQVFVSSNVQQSSDNESLEKKPHSRTTSEAWEYGFWEPNDAPEGRCHLRNILQFMTDHMNNPEVYTVDKISTEYKLSATDVVNILEYYRVFQVIIPDKGPKFMKIAQPGVKGEIADK